MTTPKDWSAEASTRMMEPTIESLLLADFAEVVNGKLYVMGAGFTAVQLGAMDQTHRFYVAAALRIPWGYTNERIDFSGRLETLDAEPLDCWTLEGQIEANRVPGQREGDTTTMFTAPVEVTVPRPMDVVLRFCFGKDERTAKFRLVLSEAAGS